ncbi:hypothetical protein NQ318_011612 [Aromia moschata]|uniref:Uncharacterized protein n=1 Tax=Aromia moschata TaxID=1265417 RepID=A0AAV8Z9T9_9CUCU|nr:hypothetical protein NQ318_011612 [Aromia moschata]
MFDNIDRRLRETGTLKRLYLRETSTLNLRKTNRNAGRQRFARNVTVEERVLNRVWEDPTLSTRRLETCCKKYGDDPLFFKKSLFTDESCFTKCGIFNLRNHHEWSDANPRATVTRHSQFRFKINYWVGILGNKVLGAVELPKMGYKIYWTCPLQDRVNMWFMQDGAAPDYALLVQQWLEENYPERWIGRAVEAPQFCPPRSPDLNPLDFYLWGELKQSVYSRQVLNIDDLRERVNNNILCIKLSVDVLKSEEKLRFNFLKRIRQNEDVSWEILGDHSPLSSELEYVCCVGIS